MHGLSQPFVLITFYIRARLPYMHGISQPFILFIFPMVTLGFNANAADAFNNLSNVKKSQVCNCVGLFVGFQTLMKGNSVVNKNEMQKMSKATLTSLMPNIGPVAQHCFTKDPKLIPSSIEMANVFTAQGNGWEQAILCTLNLVDWKIMIPPR